MKKTQIEVSDYSRFSYTHYRGPDCWGDTSETEHNRLNEEFERRIEQAFPGIEILTTLDPYRCGVRAPHNRVDDGVEIEFEIREIAERVLAGEPE